MNSTAHFEINGNPRDFEVEINGASVPAMEVEFRCGNRFQYEPQQSPELHAVAVLDVIEPVHIKGKLTVRDHFPVDMNIRVLLPAMEGRSGEVDLDLTLDGHVLACTIDGLHLPITSARVRQTVLHFAEVELYYTQTDAYEKPFECRITGTLRTLRQTTKGASNQ